MIKRINKIVAIILITATVTTIAPTTIFNKVANAAENTQNQQINIQKQINTVSMADGTEARLKESLKKTYGENCAVVIFKPETPVKSLNIPLTESMVTKIVEPMVTDELIDKIIEPKVNEAAHDIVKKQLIMAGISNPSEELINSKITDELKATIRGKIKASINKDDIIKNLSQQVVAACKNIPIYQYAAIGTDGQTVIGKGYVVGGDLADLLNLAGKDPIHVDSSILDNSVIGQLVNKIKDAIQHFEGNIELIKDKITDTITGITDALDDIADATDDLADSIKHKNNDLDDAWDKVFDRFDNDEGWGKRDGYIYYYDEDGVSLKGVQKIDGKTYYFNRIDGAMETGWQIVDGKRAYFDKDKGYQLTKQWVKDGDDWYFVDENGIAKKSAWIQDGGNTYYVKSNGKIATDWLKIDDYWYFFDESGKMATSTWKWSTDSWYYLKSDGAAANDWLQLGGKWYCFKELSGDMQTGWFRNDGNWYCSGSDGSMKTGWVWTDNGYSYLDEITGQMKKNEWATVNGKKYYFNVNGIMVTGSRYIDGTKYTFNSDGSLA